MNQSRKNTKKTLNGPRRKLLHTEEEIYHHIENNGAASGLAKLARMSLGVNPFSERKISNTIMTPAPLQIAAITSGPTVGFGSARSGSMVGMRLKGRQVWCDIISDATSSLEMFALPGQTTGTSSWYFEPNHNSFTPEPLHSLSDCFLRYKLKKLRVSYAPAVPTTNAVSVVLAFFPDPDLTLSLTDSFAELQAAQHSVSFPAYEPWAMEIPLCNSDQLFWMDSASSDSRFTTPILIRGACNTIGAGTKLGSLFMEYEVEYYDLFHITGTSFIAPDGKLWKRKELRRATRQEIAAHCSRSSAPADGIEVSDVKSCVKPIVTQNLTSIGVKDNEGISSVGQTPSSVSAKSSWIKLGAPTR